MITRAILTVTRTNASLSIDKLNLGGTVMSQTVILSERVAFTKGERARDIEFGTCFKRRSWETKEDHTIIRMRRTGCDCAQVLDGRILGWNLTTGSPSFDVYEDEIVFPVTDISRITS